MLPRSVVVPYPSGPFWSAVAPEQVTVVLLTGDTGAHAALALSTTAIGAISNASRSMK